MKKLYTEEYISDIAEALRLKQDENGEGYTTQQMKDAVLELGYGNIPAYHYTEAGRVVKAILDFKESHPNNIVFGTISDNHVNLTKESEMRSARHASFALETVGVMAECDFIANLGDNVVGNTDWSADTTAYNNAVYMDSASRSALNRLTSFNLVGNHDKSSSTQLLYDLIGKYNDFDVKAATEIRGFGYKDLTDKNVRIIALNTCDYWNVVGGYGMSYEQKDFLMQALDLSEKEGDWQIIILSHIPLDFKGGDYNTGADLKTILSAYLNGTAASITVDAAYATQQNESDKYSGTLSYDYTGKNSAEIIANIHGHIHTNAYGRLKYIDTDESIDIIRIATPNSAFSQNASTDRYTAYGDYSITTEEAAKIAKVADTKADTSATFYCIDLDEREIYCIGYGADIDRTVIYADAVLYTVSYQLNDVTSSNTATVAIEGKSYTATLSVEADYALDTVNVTMGGVDITSSVYSDGVINIPAVTGDIIITASAVDNYVPQWDIADRTAVTNMYKLASDTKEFSRKNYYYGVAATTGAVYCTHITDISLNDNDVTFTSTTKYVGIGLPYHLESGASYTFTADVTSGGSGKVGVVIYDADGVYVSYQNSDTAASPTLTFNAPTDETQWVMLVIEGYVANASITYSNISITKD